MSGLDRITGRAVGGSAHLRQSIIDILTTPQGSRVMRRDYGSRIPDLIDAPINGETVVDLYFAAAEALRKDEPRLTLERVQLVSAEAGRVELELTGLEDGVEAELSVELRVAA